MDRKKNKKKRQHRSIFAVMLPAMFFLFSFTNSYSQHETDNWYFGDQAGASFYGLPPVALTNSSMVAIEGCASISDDIGNLLFYTDGVKVWNRDHIQMPNGFGLSGDPSSTSTMIIPRPGSSTIYYIFTTDDNGGNGGLCYSIIDLTLDNGKGDVTTKNVLLYTPSTEKIAAVKHQNGTDIWVITHRWNSNEFYTYKVTTAGVQAGTPVISAVGAVHSGSDNRARGYMKASPSGSKLALAIEGMNRYELFDFNKTTGAVSNCIPITNQIYQAAYGVEFSFDEHYLYATQRWYTNLWRFDLFASNIPSSAQNITTLPTPFGGALQLGRDKKIYLARSGQEYLGVIENPQDAACIYTDHGLSLDGRTSYEGLPPYISSLFYAPVISLSGMCYGDSTYFHLTVFGSTDSVHWNFEYPSGNPACQSNLMNPAYFYSPGSHTIQLIIYYTGGTSDTLYRTINIAPPPNLNLPVSTTLCKGECFDPGAGFYNYFWSNGTNNRMICPVSSGYYTLTVTNAVACTASDSVLITVLEPPVLSLDANDVTGPGLSNGSIDMTVTGGIPPLNILWTTGQTSEDISGLSPGCYTVTVTDNQSCASIAEACVSTPQDCNRLVYKADWAKAMDFDYGTGGGYVASDNAGYIYLTGRFGDTLTVAGFPPVIALGARDIFLIKYNPSGNPVWLKTYGGTGADEPNTIAIDRFNNVYIGGTCSGTCTFAPGFSLITNSSDGFIVRLDSSGIATGLAQVGGVQQQVVTELTVDQHCNLYAAGHYLQLATIGTMSVLPFGLNDVFIAKFDSSLTPLWIKGFGSDALDEAYGDVICDTFGNVFFSFTYSGLLHIDTLLFPTLGNRDHAFLKITPLGTVEWVKTYGTSTTDGWNSSIAIDSHSNLFLCAGFGNGMAHFSDTNLTFNIANSNNILLIKMNYSGTLIWGKVVPAINAEMIIDHENNLYLAGFFSISIHFDQYTEFQSVGNWDLVLAKYDSNGLFLTANKAGSNLAEAYRSLCTDFSGNIYLGGSFNNHLEFNPGVQINAIGTEADGFLVKYKPTHFQISDLNLTGSCQSDTVCIDLGIEGGTPPFSYQWTGGLVSEDICVTQSGNYTVMVIDSAGCTRDSTVFINNSAPLALSIQGTNISTPGGSDGTVILTATGGNLPLTFLWNTNAVSQNLNGVPAGNYQVTVTDALGCEAITNIVLIEPDNPLTMAINAVNASCGGSGQNGTAELEICGGSLPYHIQWSTGDTTDSIGGLAPGWYTVTVSDNSIPGYIDTDSIYIDHDIPLMVDLGNDTTICDGGYMVLDAQNPGASYNWSNGSVMQTISVTQSGIWYVTVTNSCGSVVDSIRIVTDTSPLLLDLGNDTAFCQNASLVLDAGNPGAIYQWSNGQSGQQIAATSAGLYSVTVSNCSISISDTILLTIIPESVTSQNVQVCSGNSFDFNGHTYTLAGTYYDTLASTYGCDSVVITHLQIQTGPVYSNQHVYLCSGDSVWLGGGWQHSEGTYKDTLVNYPGCDSIVTTNLTVVPVYHTNLHYSYCAGDSIWLDNAWHSAPSVWNDTTTSIYGCDSILRFILTENPLPVVDLGNDTSVSDTEQIILNAGGGYSNYLWNNGSTSQLLTVSGSATGIGVYEYYVTVLDSNGCSGTDTVLVTVYETMSITGTGNHLLKIWPNPVQSDLNIEIACTFMSLQWSLTTVSGTTLKSGTLTESVSVLDLKEVSSGVYFLKIEGEELTTIRRIVLN